MSRELIGYGETPPVVRWPGGARVAVNIVINYEEGSENRKETGQASRESMGEAPSPVPPQDRDLANESFFEYGSRAGYWRLLRVLDEHRVRGTIFGCAVAFEANPKAARAATQRGWDICAHGNRWEEHWLMDRETERAAIARAVDSIASTAGQPPAGWYCRYGPSVNTRELVVAQGAFQFDSDSYADDLPYYVASAAGPWLVIPYALDTNDIRFWRGSLQVADDFAAYLCDAFDQLWEEGATHPRMMSVGLHCRIAGRPGRARGASSRASLTATAGQGLDSAAGQTARGSPKENDVRKNTVREIWARGETVVNGWLSIPSGFSAEVMAHQGFDSLTVDMQHGVVDYQTGVSMLQGISTTGVIPFARVPWNDPARLMKILDAGAYGVICPMINTREQAEALVAACKYPPRGYRSWGPVRASLYMGTDYGDHANDDVVVMPMIETAEALKNLDDILSVPGVDAIYVGPSDLSLALGCKPRLDQTDPPVVEAQQMIVKACKKHGVVAGIHNATAAYSVKMIDEGYQFVTLASDSRHMAMKAAEEVAVVRKTGKVGGKLPAY